MKTEVETRSEAEPEAEPKPRERITLGSLILNFFEAVGVLLGGVGEAVIEADKERQKEEEEQAQDPSRAYWDPSHPDYLLWNNRKKS